MFDPDFSKRGLGHFTILEEIAYARSEGLKYYYIGYVYDVPSFYDYKKRLPALEAFDWNGNWVPFVATGSGSE
jgi:arginine-tRNA-protein transferase